ncbi:MAG: MFS transporter, partial [Clostridia bacterium]|nr:MFS transporter [Clostridia bacterium]
GLFSPNFELLLFSRLLEGVAIGTIATIVPPLIIQLAPQKIMSIYMSFFTCFVGVGQIVIFGLSNYMVDFNNSASFKNVWIFTTILIVLSLLLWIAFVRVPKKTQPTNKPSVRLSEGFKNPLVWVVCIIVFLSVAGFNGGTNYTMSYCEYRGVDTEVANSLATFRSIFVIASSVLTGFIIAPLKQKTRAKLLIVAAALILLSFVIMWQYTNKIEAIAAMIIIGCGISVMPAIITPMTPVISGDEKLIGVTNGFIALGQNLGGVSVGLISGRLLDYAGFGALSTLYIIFGVIIVICSIFLCKKCS